MFKFGKKKSMQEASKRHLALTAELGELKKLALKSVNILESMNFLEREIAIYEKIQEIRGKFPLQELPSTISEPGLWTTKSSEIPFSFVDDDGSWMNPNRQWMEKWVNTPTEEGPMVTEKVTPYGSWLYHHKDWCSSLVKSITDFEKSAK